MTRALLAGLVAVAVPLLACGGASPSTDGGANPDGTFGCSSVPSCYSNALGALKACVPAPGLTLVPVAPSSGVIDGLTCTSSGLDVAFSSFSASQTGTVPLPSTTTLKKADGSTCAVLGTGKGSTTDGQTGTTRSFTFSSVRIGAEPEVKLYRYQDGAFALQCGGPSSELTAASGTLDACPDALQSPQVVRNADASHMGVDLVNVASTASALFTCD